MRALVVVNPAATATTPKVRDVLVRALASELKVDFAESQHRGHARELAARATDDGPSTARGGRPGNWEARAADDGVDVVLALGGDGTVNEVVNGLLEYGP